MESIPFDIVHCSSFESGYEPEQLILTQEEGQPKLLFQDIGERKGWQTKKYTEYPQDLILQLQSGLCHLSKVEILSHHYKIASQIELYTGITKDQEEDSTFIQFTRLGFVNLVNNQRCQGRELKTIQIQAEAEYIRLVIKGCHENKLNTHQQVGFIALNIVGQPIMNTAFQYEQLKQDHLSLEAHPNITIGVGISTDLELLKHWIHVIQNAEDESAQEEDYKEAKIYKEIGDQLAHLWRFLFNLEQDKLQAVATKDYDEADKIKADIIQVKRTAESILQQAGIQITSEGDILPYDDIISTDQENNKEENQVEYNGNEDNDQRHDIRTESSTIEANPDQHHSVITNPKYNTDNHELLDEAIANWTSFDALSIQDENNKVEQHSPLLLPKSKTSQQATINSNKNDLSKAVKNNSKKSKQQLNKSRHSDMITPEPLSTDDREACQLSISLFGEDLVACIMSVKTRCRQKGLNELLLHIQENRTQNDVTFIHACLILIQEVTMDSRETIFNQAMVAWKDIFEICQRIIAEENSENRNILYPWIEKFFSRVLVRTNDTNSGIRQSSTQVILDLLQLYDLSLILLCVNKDRNTIIRSIKDSKARIALITTITKKVLILQWSNKKNNRVYCQELIMFITSYLKHHSHTEVRKSAWKLLVIIAQHQDTEGVKYICSFLDSDMIKMLQQELKQEKKKKKLLSSSNSATVQGLKVSTDKSKNNGSTIAKKSTKQAKPSNEKRVQNNMNSSGTTKEMKKNKTKQQQEEQEEKTNVCIFCDEVNNNFNEDTLISHYYNHCPVLTNCSMCQIILEVSTLKEHFQNDCERKHLVKQCNNCKQFIPVEQWLQHTLKNICPDIIVTSDNQSRCAYCQLDMTDSTETDWKIHLINECPKNLRRN
ncbi:uncharacterized protein BX663DRAFT_556883 [Cokeromyces recurvatus]|uniref:uncharacterized protein n=1 Tax=Cokeromyces recurvatus TaxID=90255 RepID=UPI00221F0C5D|nr:uncharacterized protein BX663DRAFT_556883 [Cokeromyces recurvatus]KAI7907596.1 hypothetical protein BX663DRAFT_556883 [Cokeromyces recurvatus]